jgi:threonine aldolase
MTVASAAERRQQVVWKGPPRLDLRYEVTHRPTQAMWEAMMKVTPGMASSGEDPVVHELEDYVAQLTGKEATLFLPTTTNGTVLACMNRDLRGKQVIMEARCHIYWVERLHISHLAGAAPKLIRGDKFGAMDLEAIEGAINETAYGYTPPTGMICLENTHNVYGGTVLTPAYTQAAAKLAHDQGIGLFLDGARVFNSAVALGVPVRALTEPADHVVVSLNKGLGAPLGALLCGTREFIDGARVLAKRTGMVAIHKAGLFAAAGLVGLRTMYAGLADDHRRARRLAEALSEIDGLSIDLETVQTNLVRVSTKATGTSALELAHRVAEHGLAIHVLEPDVFKMALCYDVDDAQIDEALTIFQKVLA